MSLFIWSVVCFLLSLLDESSSESSSDEEEEEVGLLGKRKRPVATATPAKKPRKEEATQNGDGECSECVRMMCIADCPQCPHCSWVTSPSTLERRN